MSDEDRQPQTTKLGSTQDTICMVWFCAHIVLVFAAVGLLVWRVGRLPEFRGLSFVLGGMIVLNVARWAVGRLRRRRTQADRGRNM